MEYEMMIPPFEHKDFKSMNNKETKKYFDWFVSQVEYRIEYLKQYIDKEGVELDLDFSIDSLIPLWKWYEDKIEVVKKDKEEYIQQMAMYPEWMQPYISQEKISNDTLKIGLDISMYFAEVIIRNNPEKIRWGFFTKSKKRMSVNQPTLLGFLGDDDLNPRLIILNCTRRSSKEKNATRLYDMYNTWSKYIQ